mmetsp:Transcript_74267/g.176929  ORF Transcript_74267/g.176929 Transcript_74267/m.176929 type:complete len:617 (+) Transcript_74267:59-1909(+)
MEVFTGPVAAWVKVRRGISEFEQVCVEIEERQNQALNAKKRLAEDTKNFKRLPDTERLAGVPELLKGYQVEIDALSKRAKFAEAAFAEILKKVREGPEPKAIEDHLQSLLSRSGAGEVEDRMRQKDVQIVKLQEAYKDLEAELLSVKNQAATVRRLQQQLKEADNALDTHLAEARRQKDEEWGRRMDDANQEVLQLKRQREVHQADVERLRQQHAEEQGRIEDALAARGLEVDTLSNEVEKLQAELESERLGRTEHKETHGSVMVLQSLLEGAQRRTAVLERESIDLQSQLAAADKRFQDAEASHSTAIQELKAMLAAKAVELKSMQHDLDSRPSFEEVSDLRQQLRNVETVELSDMDGAATDLERRLLTKQKSLEGQLSDSRVQIEKQEQELQRLRSLLTVSEDEAKDLRSLVSRLELEANGPSEAKLSTLPAIEADAGQEMSLGQADQKEMPSMLEILTGQRDRLRERVGELEQERDRWRTSADEERQRLEQYKSDNVKLLERVRYLQSYQPSKPSGRGRGGRRPGPGVDADIENRYGSSFEENISPLEQFREDEKARRFADMNIGERLLVTSGTLIMASKPARLVTLVYASMLHFLVFAVLYRLAWNHTHGSG